MWDLSEGTDLKCDLVFANDLTEECLKHYNSLPKKGKAIAEKEWTLLSAVVMSLEKKLTVVAMASGTKCLGQNQMSRTGDLVNDSHAEVLARRTFIRYIYDQIKEFKDTGSSTIITKRDDENKFEIDRRIQFHFYTSHVPCGDASIVPKFESSTKRKGDTIKSNSVTKKLRLEEQHKKDNDSQSIDDTLTDCLGEVVDVHRTGAKHVFGQDSKCPGALYHLVGAVRTKPGRGDPTLSLSCSDKLARWIACGIQGALLSLLLSRPVLLETVVVGGGGPYCFKAMHRALISRTNPSHCPRLLRATVVFPQSRYRASPTAKPCPAAILWARVTHKALEVCVEGRRQGATKSSGAKGRLMVCKQELLRSFITVAEEFYRGMTYRDIKASAVHYYNTWSQTKTALGAWTTKPLAFQDFVLLH